MSGLLAFETQSAGKLSTISRQTAAASPVKPAGASGRRASASSKPTTDNSARDGRPRAPMCFTPNAVLCRYSKDRSTCRFCKNADYLFAGAPRGLDEELVRLQF